jgi:hypothetical protein
MPDALYASTTPETAPVYAYYTVNIITNEVLAQIPFEDVSYERRVKEPGAFEGAISITGQTEDLDLYNSTMPGKVALYVTRNGVCVWGGIIWGRTYDLVERALSISALEFSSYLQKRVIWKTYSYKFECEILKTTKAGDAKITLTKNKIKIPLKAVDSKGEATKVYVSFTESNLVQYTGYYSVSPSPEPTQTEFYVSIPNLPASAGVYQSVSVSVKVDTYDYIREMLNDVLKDFSDTTFANEIIAPGIKEPHIITHRGSSDNVVTITTEDRHGMVTGQRIDIFNINKTLCGKQTVSEVTTPYQFKYIVPVLNITYVERASGVATVYIDTSGGQYVPFVVDQEVIITSSDSGFNNSGAAVAITAVTESSISYENAGSNAAKTSATGKVTIANVTYGTVDAENYRVYSREITSTGKKNIEYVKRVAGDTWVWTTAPHGFKKADKVSVTFADINDYETLNNDKIPVSILSTTTYSFKYRQDSYSNSKYDIKGSDGSRVTMAKPSKHKAVLATPVKRLKINTAGTHTFGVDDLVHVRGVDRIDWTSSIYDGYHKVAELDTSEGIASAEVLTTTDFSVTSDLVVTLWLNREHGVSVGDLIEVTGFTSTLATLNTKTRVTDVYDVEGAASGVSWVQYKLGKKRANVAKTASTAGKVAVFGASWFTFEMPEWGATREPDDTIQVTHVKYKKAGRVVTLTTATKHNCTVGDRVKVDIKGKLYDGTHTVTAAWTDADQISYSLSSSTKDLPSTNIGTKAVTGSITRVKTSVGYIPTLSVPIDRLGRDANLATIYSVDHDFATGDNITIEIDPTESTYSSFENSGNVIPITATTDNTYSYASVGSDVGVFTVTAANVVSNVATLTTSTAHGYAVGQSVNVSKINATYNGTHVITAVSVSPSWFKYALKTSNTSSAGLSGRASSTAGVTANLHYAYIDYTNIGRSQAVTNLSSAANVVTMTSADHGFIAGDYVITYVKGKTYNTFKNGNQPVRIKSVTTNTFTYDSLAGYLTGTVSSTAVEGYAVFAPQIEKTPVAMTRTYGEFPNNSAMGGLEFSTDEYSSTQYPNDTIRGSDLITVFEHLERYTSTKDGFDYRIDCSLVEGYGDKKKFKRTFVLIPRIPEILQDYLDTLPDKQLSPGTYAPPSAFGADRIVFEYPGNIQNVSFSENTTNSATRVFVVGNNDDVGGSASARYSASASTDLLNDGWPLIDKVEKVEWPVKGINAVNTDDWGNYDAEKDLQLTSERFLNETKPPSGDIIISVNGSLNPEIGTFNPGDWCSVVIRDNFVQQRMYSTLEPRKDVIVRKIDGIRVAVPNSPAFPEMIDLTLIAEWQVDKVGK